MGVNWLKLLHQNKVNGVLADDMGLGKTVQTIAFIGWLKFTHKKGRTHLIVVPASTLENWWEIFFIDTAFFILANMLLLCLNTLLFVLRCNELQKFCPDLNIIVYHGSQRERDEIRGRIKRGIEHGNVDGTYHFYLRFRYTS